MQPPLEPLPEPLRGSDPDSFAQRTITERLPSIAQRTLQESDWPAPARQRLQALIDEMPHGLLRPLDYDGGPDVADWRRYMRPYLGQSWLQPPWFVVETFFFRRILEAAGYYRPGPGRGVDPFAPQKRQELAGVHTAMRRMCDQLDALGHPLQMAQIEEMLVRLLHTNIWGNQADLSMWPGGSSEGPQRPRDDRLAEHLLVDQASDAVDYLARRAARRAAGREQQAVRVDFILDNSGQELAYDLGLADFLLTSQMVPVVRLWAKPHPTYVSDATIQDVLDLIDYLAIAPDDCVRRLALRLHDHLGIDRLELTTDYYWTSPLSGWEMPLALHSELMRASLVISKGDANYRRWLGDRYWPHTTSLEDILVYQPAPMLMLRVLKANLVVGLPPGQSEAMQCKDPNWLHNGHWGVIQFAH